MPPRFCLLQYTPLYDHDAIKVHQTPLTASTTIHQGNLCILHFDFTSFRSRVGPTFTKRFSFLCYTFKQFERLLSTLHCEIMIDHNSRKPTLVASVQHICFCPSICMSSDLANLPGVVQIGLCRYVIFGVCVRAVCCLFFSNGSLNDMGSGLEHWGGETGTQRVRGG